MNDLRTISDVAARTGFTASALRFYEDAGLIEPVRSRSGYRLYDERAVERLQFISRAKQLGLSLDEITELLVLWDGDRCAPVAGRLSELVEDKLHDTQRRITELVAFAADLERFRYALQDGDRHDGPCGATCACTAPSSAASAPTAVTLGSKPIARTATEPPIACTLDPTAATQRIADWRQLLERCDGPPQPVEHGVTFRFPPDRELTANVAALAAAEQACCAFLTFDLHLDHAGTHLTVTAPGDAQSVLADIFKVAA